MLAFKGHVGLSELFKNFPINFSGLPQPCFLTLRINSIGDGDDFTVDVKRRQFIQLEKRFLRIDEETNSRLVLVIASFALSGCRKDEEVRAILAAVDSFTTELVGKVQTANPSDGVNEAQKYLDSRKGEIKTSLETLKGLRGSQVSDETKQKITSSLVDDASKVGNLQIKYVNQSMKDPAFKANLDKLVKDYQAVLAQQE